MKREILRIENMTVRLQDKLCLKNVDFNLFEGELLAVTGLNNAGKTVLAGAIAGMIPFSADHIFRDEEEMSGPGEYSRATGDVFYISRESQLVDDFTIAQNIFGLQKRFSLSVFREREANERAMALMSSLGCTLSPSLRAGELNTAQRHLVAICRAAASGARIIILDGIANQYSAEDFKTLEGVLGRLSGFSVIYVSHNSDPILMLADRVALLRGSTIIGFLYKGGFRPEQLMAGLSNSAVPAEPPAPGEIASGAPLLLAKLVLDGGSFTFELRPGEVAVIQDSRDFARSSLIGQFMEPRSCDIRIGGHPVRSFRQAVRAGLTVIPEELAENCLFDCMSEEENLTFQIIRKTSTAGLLNPRILRYAQEKYSEALSTEACMSSRAWRAYKLCLYRAKLANGKLLVLEDPAAGMDGVILRELLSVLAELSQQGMGIVIITNHYGNYAKVCSRVLDTGLGRSFRPGGGALS